MISRKLAAGLFTGLAGVLTMTFGNGQLPLAGTANSSDDPHHMDHVFVIMMENHGREQILDPNNAGTPHLRALAKEYGTAMTTTA